MLDHTKTGMFICDIRKEKGLTQKQLADEIGVSDKTISKWENGRGMPDTSIMPELCRVLGININEAFYQQVFLFSCHKLSVQVALLYCCFLALYTRPAFYTSYSYPYKACIAVSFHNW